MIMPKESYLIRCEDKKLFLEFTFADQLRAQYNERAFFQALQNGDLHRILQHNMDTPTPFFQDNLSDVVAKFPEYKALNFRYSKPAFYELSLDANSDECEIFYRACALLKERGFDVSDFSIEPGSVKLIFKYR